MLRILFCISVFSFISVFSHAQDRNKYIRDIYEYNVQLETLVNRVVDSLGGKEANLNIKSYQSSGEISYQTGEKALFDMFYMKPDWIRIDQKFDEEYQFFSRHGRKGWTKTLAKEGTKEKNLRGIPLSEEEQFHLYENNLFDYKKKQLDIYYEGEVQMGEIKVEVIRLSGFSYGEEMYFISTETYRPLMKQVYILDGDYQAVVNYTILEYIKVNDAWLPKKLGVKKGDDVKEIDFFRYDLTASFDKDLFVKR